MGCPATFSGLLNTYFRRTPQTILHIENLGGLLNRLHFFFYYLQQYSIPRGLPAIVSVINLSSCLCCIGRNPHGDHSICGPWPRNSNPVTVELGTFRHSSILPAISMDFQKDKKQLTRSPRSASHDQPEGEQPDTTPGPGIVLPTSSSAVSSKYHIHQILLISPLAFPNPQLHNLLPFDTRPRNEALGSTPRGNMTRRSEEAPRAIKLAPPRKSMKVKEKKNNKKTKQMTRQA